MIIIPFLSGYFIGNIPNIFRQTHMDAISHLSLVRSSWLAPAAQGHVANVPPVPPPSVPPSVPWLHGTWKANRNGSTPLLVRSNATIYIYIILYCYGWQTRRFSRIILLIPPWFKNGHFPFSVTKLVICSYLGLLGYVSTSLIRPNGIGTVPWEGKAKRILSLSLSLLYYIISGWWFGTFFIFHNMWE